MRVACAARPASDFRRLAETVLSGERRLPACNRRQLADDVVFSKAAKHRRLAGTVGLYFESVDGVRSCSMAERFVNVDRQTPMFLPPDLREWVADNELAHLILEAVELCDVR